MTQHNPAADLNLLFGILAVQLDFITRDQLAAATRVWVQDKSSSLGAILVEQKVVSPDRLALLQALVQEHLKQHQNDPRQSLSSLDSASSVKNDLEQIADSDVQASLVHVCSTRSFDDIRNSLRLPATVGAPTSAGTRFRILRPHAKGGLGQVSVAHDEELHREVALKEILDHHAHDAAARTRFLVEAEITGGLEHPGIVPVYGLGAYADGRPFYAMRFIRGDSLKDAIQSFHKPAGERCEPAGSASFTSLPFRKLLGRFLDVCNAIAYAHSRGVLHRDLKPGNIMLGKYGETLVVDWGLAKAGHLSAPGRSATENEEATLCPASASGSSETVAGTAFGTPAFMSPEQAAGRLDLLGPATDIYSLGATLYVLLTGKIAFTAKDQEELLRKVQSGDFLPPRRLKPDLPAPLEAVCLKAMASQPRDRYANALDLAADIEHWLADEPVKAWPEPAIVRLGRWTRKHKPLVSGAAAALLVGLISASAGTIWYQDEQAKQATAGAARQVEAERQQAKLDAEELARKVDVERKQAKLDAEEAARRAEAERKQALAEQAIAVAVDQAERLRAELDQNLREPGGVFKLLNEPKRWQVQIQLAQGAVDRAKALLANADAPVKPDLNARIQRLETNLGQDEADRQLALRLERIRLESATIGPSKLDFSRYAREYPKAFKEANLQILERDSLSVGKQIASSAIKEQLVAALDGWAAVEFKFTANKNDVTERLFEVTRAVDPGPGLANRLRDPVLWKDRSGLTKLADEYATAKLSPQLSKLFGDILKGNNLESEAWLRRAQAQYPSDFWLNFDLGGAIEQSKPAEAEGFYRAALAVRPASGVAYYNLGVVLISQKRDAEAIAALQMASELEPRFAKAFNNLGNLLHDHNRSPEAIAAYRKAIDIDPEYANAYHNLGVVLGAQKRLTEAREAYQKAIKFDSEHPKAYYNFGNVLRELGHLAEASAAYQKHIELNPKYANGYNNLGMVLADQGRQAEAVAAYQKAVDINPTFAIAHYNLGNAFQNLRRSADAIVAYQKAINADPQFGNAHGALGRALLSKGMFGEAAAATQKAMDILPVGTSARDMAVAQLRECQQLLSNSRTVVKPRNFQERRSGRS